MNKYKIVIWGRSFELPVVYECYPGEEVLESQKEAFELFAENAKEVAKSLEAVKKYVRKNSNGLLDDDTIENIFKYVMPKGIFVPHTEKRRSVAIMCDYKFDMEHGMAVVFDNGKIKEIGTQDIVL